MKHYMTTKINHILIAAGCLLLGTSAVAQFTEQAKVVSPERGSRDEYGSAVDIRDNYAISGTPRFNIAAGAAYIYAKDDNGEWSYLQSLIPDDSMEMAEYGSAVKITDDYIVVASGRADIGNSIRAGALYVYDKNAEDTWDFSTKIIASDVSEEAKLGMNHTTLDADGETIACGAPGDNGWAGSVYIFERVNDGWIETQKIMNPDPLANDTFGIAVALSGDIMVVGANETNNTRGSAYVYTRNTDGVWMLEQQITATDGMPQDFFGTSVSIDNETIVVGAYGDDTLSGSAYIFKKDGSGTWTEIQKLVPSVPEENAYFGWQCEIKNNNLIIGAPHAWGSTNGAAFMFQENAEGMWIETQIVQSNDIAEEDFYGWSVSLYGDQVMVGAPWEDHDEYGNNEVDRAGSAYIFKDPTLLGTDQFSHTENTLRIFPNPGQNSIHIESSAKNILNVLVYGATGTLLQKIEKVNKDFSSLDISPYSNGIYFVDILFEDGSSTQHKILKSN